MADVKCVMLLIHLCRHGKCHLFVATIYNVIDIVCVFKLYTYVNQKSVVEAIFVRCDLAARRSNHEMYIILV